MIKSQNDYKKHSIKVRNPIKFSKLRGIKSISPKTPSKIVEEKACGTTTSHFDVNADANINLTWIYQLYKICQSYNFSHQCRQFTRKTLYNLLITAHLDLLWVKRTRKFKIKKYKIKPLCVIRLGKYNLNHPSNKKLARKT